MATAVIIAPRLLRVLEVVGKADSPVHDLHFEGITFSHTEWQPPADYASSLQAGVEVPGALFFDYAERCVVPGGAIEHIGNCGISVGSVQDFGPSQARGNIIEYNHVHDIGQGMLSDLAAIDTCSTPGSRIRFNRVHDVSRRDYGGWGIYPDQGSHDLLIQNNLLYRCQDGALFAHHTCRLFVPGAWESASGREHSEHERFLEGIHWCRMLRLPTHRPLHVAASQRGSDLSVWRPNSTQLENPHGESVCMVCRGDSRGRLAQPGGGR